MRLRAIGAVKRFLAHSTGQFAIMTAITAPVGLVLAAVAIDSGSLYVDKRHAQSLADLAAIAAAANLDKARAAAVATLAANDVAGLVVDSEASETGGDEDRLVVITGRYDGDPALPANLRFVPEATPPNAAKVTYRTFGTRHFAGALIPPPEIVVSGIASVSAQAGFSIGSRLLALDGGLVNALLGGLTGSNVSLSIMDYDALLDADVSLLSFLDALATDLDLTAGSYREVLDAELTVGQIAKALSGMDGLSGTAKAAASKLAMQAGGAQVHMLQLSQLISLGEAAHVAIEQVAAEVNVLELLSLGAILAGKGKQVALDLGANVPGVLAVSIDLAIGEPPQNSPWFTIGSGGELVRTAQTRLALTAQIGGLGGLLGTRIRIPLYLELAYAEARLKSITCPTGRPDSIKVVVEARPGIANLYLAEVDPSKIADFANPAPRSPARLVQMPLITVTGQAHAEVSNMEPRPLTFRAADIEAGTLKQVSTQDFVGSLAQSLFSNLTLDVNVIGLGLGLPSNVTALLGNTIGAVAPAIDGLLNNLLATLGLSLGQADVRVYGATCGRAVLVQ